MSHNKQQIVMKISELHHPDKNIRKHSRKQIEEMKRSIEKFGQFRAVVVDDQNIIRCGNGLVMALREMGREECDVIKYEDLTESDKKKLMIADNQIASLGTDDMEVIEEFIRSLDDFDVPGYDEETLEMLVAESESVTQEVMSYGIYTPEEVESVRKYEDVTVKPVVQTYQEPVQRTGMTEPPQYTEARANAPQDMPRETVPMEREQYVICPHCGEKIWLE